MAFDLLQVGEKAFVESIQDEFVYTRSFHNVTNEFYIHEFSTM